MYDINIPWGLAHLHELMAAPSIYRLSPRICGRQSIFVRHVGDISISSVLPVLVALADGMFTEANTCKLTMKFVTTG